MLNSLECNKVRLVFEKEQDIIALVAKTLEPVEEAALHGHGSGLCFATIRLRDMLLPWRKKKKIGHDFVISESASLSFLCKKNYYSSVTALFFDIMEYAVTEKKTMLFFGHKAKQEYKIRHNIKLLFGRPFHGSFISKAMLQTYSPENILKLLMKTAPHIIFVTPHGEPWLKELVKILPNRVFFMTQGALRVFTAPRKGLRRPVSAVAAGHMAKDMFKEFSKGMFSPLNWLLFPYMLVLAWQLHVAAKQVK